MLAAMLRNYLAAALRNLLRDRLYAVINVAGLGVGFAAALLIALFIRDELSYDRFFEQNERVYRVYAVGKPPVTGLNESEQTETGVVQWLPLAFPEIERAASLVKDKRAIRRGDFEVEEEVTWATERFFEIFRRPGRWVVSGDPVATLKQPGGVVLTRSMARKYFGRDDAVGGMLEMDRKTPLRVGAVIEDLPSNTHLKLGIIGVAGPDFQSGEWPSTYVKLAANGSPARIQQGMASAIDRHMPLQSVDTGRGRDSAMALDASDASPAARGRASASCGRRRALRAGAGSARHRCAGRDRRVGRARRDHQLRESDDGACEPSQR